MVKLAGAGQAIVALTASLLAAGCSDDRETSPFLAAESGQCQAFEAAPEPLHLDVADESRVRFIAFGDWGVEPRRIEAAADAMWSFCQQAGCDFVLGLGDNFYEDGVTSVTDRQWREKFEEPFGDWDIPFYMTLGNHDYRGNEAAQVAYTLRSGRWVMPAPAYTVQAGPVTLVAADTNVACPQQAQWLAEQARAATTAWRVAFGHHPWYSSGEHGDSTGGRRALLEWAFCDQIDLYVAGHDHDLEMLRAECGVALVVSGAPVRSRAIAPGLRSIFASPDAGFAWFEATPDELRIELRALDGRLLESLTLERAEREPACLVDGLCAPGCAVDPDCTAVSCLADGVCQPSCGGDPDCYVNCPCDRTPGTCEQLVSGELAACGCDPWCRRP